MNDGMWNDTRLINHERTDESTSQNGLNPSCGYHRCLTTYQVGAKRVDASYYAGGRGGQYIIFTDELDTVMVFSAGNEYRPAWVQPRDLNLRYILPSAF